MLLAWKAAILPISQTENKRNLINRLKHQGTCEQDQRDEGSGEGLYYDSYNPLINNPSLVDTTERVLRKSCVATYSELPLWCDRVVLPASGRTETRVSGGLPAPAQREDFPATGNWFLCPAGYTEPSWRPISSGRYQCDLTPVPWHGPE